MYSQTTHDVKITVVPAYQDEASHPYDNHFVWSYNIYVENYSNSTIQLVSRHWQIIDSFGNTDEVRGSGVVGQQPVLKPGEAFEYTSETHLKTPSGIMMGEYQMVNTETNEPFEVPVPPFSLDSDYEHTRLN